MDVSKNIGTPKSSILIGLSIRNHFVKVPMGGYIFWGVYPWISLVFGCCFSLVWMPFCLQHGSRVFFNANYYGKFQHMCVFVFFKSSFRSSHHWPTTKTNCEVYSGWSDVDGGKNRLNSWHRICCNPAGGFQALRHQIWRRHLTWQSFWKKACFGKPAVFPRDVSALEDLVCQPQRIPLFGSRWALFRCVFTGNRETNKAAEVGWWTYCGEKEVFAKESAPVPQLELRDLRQLRYQQSFESGERGLKKPVLSLEILLSGSSLLALANARRGLCENEDVYYTCNVNTSGWRRISLYPIGYTCKICVPTFGWFLYGIYVGRYAIHWAFGIHTRSARIVRVKKEKTCPFWDKPLIFNGGRINITESWGGRVTQFL